MKYQLVLQLPEKKYGDIDQIADIEDQLDEHLVDAEIDGHDIGSGEVNIFIHTNNPTEIFEAVKKTLEKGRILDDAKIAYRDLNEDVYTCLWPRDLTKFSVI